MSQKKIGWTDRLNFKIIKLIISYLHGLSDGTIFGPNSFGFNSII